MSRIKAEYRQKYPYPRHQLRRGILRAGIAFLVGALLNFTVEGKENLPKDGPLLIVGNHFHFLDTIAPIHVTKYPLEFINDAVMPMAPGPMRFIPSLWRTLKILQGTANLEAMRASEAILAQNGVLAIFPEGHVHKPPLGKPLTGAAFLALRLGVPIVPIGTYSEDDWDIFGTIRRKKRRARIHSRIGKVFGPLAIGDTSKVPGREDVQRAGHEIMENIARVLPAHARGPYLRGAEAGLESC